MPKPPVQPSQAEEIDLSTEDEAILRGIESDIRTAGGWQNFDPMSPPNGCPTEPS